MKKLIIIMLFISTVAYTQTTTPVYKDVSFDSAATVSDSLKLNRGKQLAGLFIAQGLTDSVQFKVSRDGTNWFFLQDPGDGTKYTVVIDSSMAAAIPLKPILCYPWNWYQVVLGDAAADTDATSVDIVEIPYLSH